MIARRFNARQDILHLRLIVNELQQRLSVGSFLANAKYVFGGRVQSNDQQMLVKQYDPRTQRVENCLGVSVDGPIVAGAVSVFFSGPV